MAEGLIRKLEWSENSVIGKQKRQFGQNRLHLDRINWFENIHSVYGHIFFKIDLHFLSFGDRV